MKLEQWHIWAILCVVFFVIGMVLLNKNKESFETKDYLEGIDVIYWINLDRSPDRRKRMKKMFKDPAFKGKKIIRISAVDGKGPDIDQVLNANFDGMQPEKFTKVEYACTLSHLNAIKQFSKSNDQVALIMEDDMTLEYKKYWGKSVKELMEKAPSDWEIIQLCYTSKIPVQNIYTENKGNVFGACAYLINKKINKPKYTLITHTDHTSEGYIFSMFKTYVYKYPLFIWKYNNMSTIHQDHVYTLHNPIKKMFDRMYKNKTTI